MYEDHVENISFGCSVTMAQVFFTSIIKKIKNDLSNYSFSYYR